MNLKIIKKQYFNQKVLNYFFNNDLIFFINCNDSFFKKQKIIKTNLKIKNLYFHFLKNNSNFFVNKKNNKFKISGVSSLIYYFNRKNNINIIDILISLKKETFIFLNFKYKNKIYNNLSIKYLLKYKTINTVFYNFFSSLYQINYPHKNLLLNF
jgi:hypothetical protein